MACEAPELFHKKSRASEQQLSHQFPNSSAGPRSSLARSPANSHDIFLAIPTFRSHPVKHHSTATKCQRPSLSLVPILGGPQQLSMGLYQALTADFYPVPLELTTKGESTPTRAMFWYSMVRPCRFLGGCASRYIALWSHYSDFC